MRTQAVRVDTPGTSQDNLRDSGTLVYASGAKKTTPELQKQREKRKKATAEASKKVHTDVLGVVGGKTKAKVVRKGGGKKGGKKGGQKGVKKGTKAKSVRLWLLFIIFCVYSVFCFNFMYVVIFSLH